MPSLTSARTLRKIPLSPQEKPLLRIEVKSEGDELLPLGAGPPQGLLSGCLPCLTRTSAPARVCGECLQQGLGRAGLRVLTALLLLSSLSDAAREGSVTALMLIPLPGGRIPRAGQAGVEFMLVTPGSGRTHTLSGQVSLVKTVDRVELLLPRAPASPRSLHALCAPTAAQRLRLLAFSCFLFTRPQTSADSSSTPLIDWPHPQMPPPGFLPPQRTPLGATSCCCQWLGAGAPGALDCSSGPVPPWSYTWLEGQSLPGNTFPFYLESSPCA